MKYIIYIFILIYNISYSQQQKIDYTQFKGEKANITISKKYTFSKLYDYKINSQNLDSLVTKPFNKNIPERVLTTKYALKLSDNKNKKIVFAINLISNLKIDIKDKRFVFIKYKIKEEEKRSESKIIIITKENNLWKESSLVSNEITIIQSIMLNSSVSLLYKFHGSTDNKKYPEINKLKPLAKNGSVLDIQKLEKVLIENQTALKKYLDN